jgi:hypothetical protein
VPEPATRGREACLSWSCRLYEAMCADEAAAMWFPAGPAGAPVSMRLRRIGSSTVPESKFVPVQSSIRPTLLQSSFSTAAAPRFRAPPPPTSGLRPPLDITAPLPICRAFHRSTGADPGVLNRSTASATQLAGLFRPAAELRARSRSGVCPLRAAFSSSRADSAPAVQLRRAHL